MTRSEYNPTLDGLRAVSIALVLAAHAGLSRIVPGGLGVTIFFVVSGFLITTLLREEHARTGRIRFGRFYARRALRLVPAASAYVLIAGFAFSLIAAPIAPLAWAAAVLDLANVAEIFSRLFDAPRSAAGAASVPHPFVILWSLAIEEHAYLLWPPLLALALARGNATRLAILGLAALAVVSLAWRCHLATLCVLPPHPGSPPGGLCGIHADQRIYKATDTRLDAIGFGALASFLARARLLRRPETVAIAALLLLLSLAIRDPFFRETARDTVQGVALLVLVPALAASRGPLPRLLASGPLVAVGRLSYGLYLWHWLALILATRWAAGSPAFVPVFLALTALFAALSWHLLEAPVLALRRRLGSDAPDGIAPVPRAAPFRTGPIAAPGHANAAT